MKRIAGAAFLLFTLQLTAGIPHQQTDKAAPGYFTGRVTDETGKPVFGVPVRALQSANNAADSRTFRQVGGVITDDRGDYRLMELAPGRYYIAIGDAPGRSSSSPSGELYALRFYPGVGDISQAMALEIFPGSATQADLKAVRQ